MAFRNLVIMEYPTGRLYKSTLNEGEDPKKVIRELGFIPEEVNWMTSRNNVNLTTLDRN